DLVPLRGARRKVTHRYLEPAGVGEAGQFLGPSPHPVAVGATRVGTDQQPGRRRVAVPALTVPPAAQGRDRERGVSHRSPPTPTRRRGQVVAAVGTALWAPFSGKSWAGTRPGCPARCQSRPAAALLAEHFFLLGVHADLWLPGRGELLDLAVDIPKLRVAVDGGGRPRWSARCPAGRTPRPRGSAATVSAPTGCPCRVSSAASFGVDFTVQRNGDSGSPRRSGSTSASRAGTRPGSRSRSRLRPAPTARTRSAGSPPNSRAPRAAVDSATRATRATRRTPPYPNTQAAAPNARRRCRSSRWGSSAAKASPSTTSVCFVTPRSYGPTTPSDP